MSPEPLPRLYFNLLKRHIDFRDWGIRDHDGVVKSQLTNDQLWAALEGRRKPIWLNRSLIDQHVSSAQTLYYRSARGARAAMLCVDVDAHDGQTDAWDVVEFLKGTYYPDAYVELSTNGRGYHRYLLVWNDGGRHVFNMQMVVVANALNCLLRDHNFGSTVEVRGTYTTLAYDFYGKAEWKHELDTKRTGSSAPPC